jgi:hypothetical protein
VKPLALLAVLAAAGLAACGGGGDADGTVPAAVSGPGISIEEALERGSDEPVLVNGNLLVLDGRPRLCSALAESFPPQCSGAALLVTGLSLSGLDGLNSEAGVTWIDRPIKLLGVVSHGVLTVSDNASS